MFSANLFLYLLIYIHVIIFTQKALGSEYTKPIVWNIISTFSAQHVKLDEMVILLIFQESPYSCNQ